MAVTTIQVKVETRDLLKSLGRKGETYDDIIRDAVEKARYVDFMEESYEVLAKERNWKSLDEME